MPLSLVCVIALPSDVNPLDMASLRAYIGGLESLDGVTTLIEEVGQFEVVPITAANVDIFNEHVV